MRGGALMRRGRRLLTGFWLAIAVLVLTGCGAEILHDLPESDANEVVTALQSHGIDARKKTVDEAANTWSINVPRSDSGRSLALLREHKLPRKREAGLGDAFDSGGIIKTPMHEKVQYLLGLQGDLTNTLESIGGVIDASVHIALPEKDRTTGVVREDPTASALVEYQPIAGELPVDKNEIRGLIAHSVPGLSEKNVQVVLKPASIVAPMSTGGGRSDVDLVDVAGVVVERGSVSHLKLLTGAGLALLLALGVLLFLGGRANDQLKLQVQGLERQLESRRRRPLALGGAPGGPGGAQAPGSEPMMDAQQPTADRM